MRHLQSISAQIPNNHFYASFNEYTGFLWVLYSPDLMYHPLFNQGSGFLICDVVAFASLGNSSLKKTQTQHISICNMLL